MHRSRFAGLIIDCETQDLGAGAAFWSRALGYGIRPSPRPEDQQYVILDTAGDEPYLELQRVSHPSRVHLDIESDDIDAEAARLEKLGARRVGKVKRWWVMEAPTGHRFCIVPAERPDFADNANVWDD